MNVPNQRFTDGIQPWQSDALKAFDQGCRRFDLCIHRRSRKSTLALNLSNREAVRFPRRTYLYIAPMYKQAKAIAWADVNMLPSILPDPNIYPWKRNEVELTIIYPNKSRLVIKGGDDPDSIRGIDCEGVVFDEWALCKPEIYHEILRPILAQDANRWAVFIYTPKGCNHAYDMHLAAQADPDWYSVLLTADDTGMISPAELAKARKEMPSALFQQEFYCSFLAASDFVVISPADIEALRLRAAPHPRERWRVVACDPSGGGDETVIYYVDTGEVLDELYLQERDTMRVAAHILSVGKKHDCNEFAVDSCGLGLGVCDKLTEMGGTVHRFDSAAQAIKDRVYLNLRAEAWFNVANMAAAFEIPYPMDNELRRELTSTLYIPERSRGRIQLEPKIQTRKRLGRSPDRADTYVIACWARDYVPHYDKYDKRIIHKTRMDWSDFYSKQA